MHGLDIAVFIILTCLIIGFGYFKSTTTIQNTESFFLAGRTLSLPGFIASLVTTWYGGILGVGENTVQFGIQTWVIFGCPYYVFAFLFAIYIVPKIRNSQLVTIPDHLRKSFGHKTGIISAVFIFILSSPAPYILSLGMLVNSFFHIPFGWSILCASIASLGYVWKGGLPSVVRTDLIQFLFMFGGFIILLIAAWLEFGSPLKLIKHLPKSMVDPTGGNSVQYILVWFFIALWTFIDPGFHQRTIASSSNSIARKGIIISIGFWFFFDILSVTTALYATELLNNPNSLFVYQELALTLLPPGLVGLFFVGIFAIIMSTLDSFGLISASTFGRDIMWRMESKLKRESDPLPHIKKGLIVSTFVSLLLVTSIPSVVKLWYVTGSILIPGLLFPFLYSIFFPKRSLNHTELILTIPAFISFSWYILGRMNHSWFLQIEPFYPGLLVSGFLILLNSPKLNQELDSISSV